MGRPVNDIVIPDEGSGVPDDAVWIAARAYREFERGHPSHPDAIHAALEAALPALRRQWEAELTMTPSEIESEADRLHDTRVRVVVEGNLGQVAGAWIFPGESEIALEDVKAIHAVREYGETK